MTCSQLKKRSAEKYNFWKISEKAVPLILNENAVWGIFCILIIVFSYKISRRQENLNLDSRDWVE